jgi:hypothetical protein
MRELSSTIERRVLRHLEGSASPGFLQEGVFEDRFYLAMDWCAASRAVTNPRSSRCDASSPVRVTKRA